MSRQEIIVGVGGEAGEGIGRTGDAIAKIAARHGLHIYAYNSYQSVIRGGHVWLRIRIATEKVHNHGDHLHVLIALNQDTFDRHLREVAPDGWVLFNTEVVRVPEDHRGDLHYCGVPCKAICKDLGYKPVMQNTVLLGAAAWILQFDFSYVEGVMQDAFKHKGDAVVRENVQVALRGYEYARENFQPIRTPFPRGPKPLAVTTGNEMFALGAVAAGCKFYAAYPMTPASSILHWFARYGPELGVVVKQCEDELAVINFAIGAGFAGVRALCATSGGGFSLMTEAIGEAAMTETPVVAINVMRGGPSTGLPTKTEQADFWQLFGASQGDYPKMILAPTDILDCYYTMAEAFNWAERYQIPVLIASDLYLSEHRETVDPEDIRFDVPIDRGEAALREWPADQEYKRFADTPTGVSPRVLPGTPGVCYTAATDEHDERGILISDVGTDPVKRKKSMDKRMRKLRFLRQEIPAPQVIGPERADVTLVGWGSTKGILIEAADLLTRAGISTNVLALKYLYPFPSDGVMDVLRRSPRVIVVEQNYTGQLMRHIRAETGFLAHGAVRKYDGEPMEPLYVVEGVKAILENGVTVFPEG